MLSQSNFHLLCIFGASDFLQSMKTASETREIFNKDQSIVHAYSLRKTTTIMAEICWREVRSLNENEAENKARKEPGTLEKGTRNFEKGTRTVGKETYNPNT